MEKLQTITHPKFGCLSVIVIDGKEFFKAKECAVMLGYKDTINAVKQHCKGVVKHHLPTKSGKQTVNLIPEGDLWRLIIRSKLPQAEEIEKWIMEDVLPSIRKTGSYSMPQKDKHPEPYEYFDKTYNGDPVLSTADVSYMTGIKKCTVDWFMRTKLTINFDYYLLRKSELAKFKAENPKVSKIISCMYVITKSGFDTICKAYGINLETPKLFIEEKKEETPHVCPPKFVTPQLKEKMAVLRESAERLIHLTYLLDNAPGVLISGNTYHEFSAAIIRQAKKISYFKL